MAKATKVKPKPKAKAKPSIPKCPAGKFNLAGLKEGKDGYAPLEEANITTVDAFLQSGESDSYWGRQPCVREDGGNLAVFVIRGNGSLVRCGSFSSSGFLQSSCWTNASGSAAVLVKSSKPKLRKFDLILNGDDSDPDDEPSICLEDKSDGITASFQIFSELLGPIGKRIRESQIVGWLNDGTIQILDCSSDETRKLNPAAQRKVAALKEKNNNRTLSLEKLRTLIRPPEAGFTLMAGLQWHRAATILFRHSRKVYLIGQDGGTYFGCELADRPETIKEAYYSLMPERARKIVGPERQGEWFAIPVPASKVPAMDKCLATFDREGGDNGIVLPREKGGHAHSLTSDDGRITAAGVFVKGGCLYHEEHEELNLSEKRWMTFVKNTAVRSVSMEGVD